MAHSIGERCKVVWQLFAKVNLKWHALPLRRRPDPVHVQRVVGRQRGGRVLRGRRVPEDEAGSLAQVRWR